MPSLFRRSFPILFASLIWAAFSYADIARADTAQGFQKSRINVETRQGRRFNLDVFLALTREQHIRGLMHVDELPELEGMLFVYAQIRPVSIWMKNTPLPLDILFIRDDGSIARIEKNTTPYSTDSIHSGEPVRGVLELNAGVADKLRINKDDFVVSDFFAVAPDTPDAGD